MTSCTCQGSGVQGAAGAAAVDYCHHSLNESVLVMISDDYRIVIIQLLGQEDTATSLGKK